MHFADKCIFFPSLVPMSRCLTSALPYPRACLRRCLQISSPGTYGLVPSPCPLMWVWMEGTSRRCKSTFAEPSASRRHPRGHRSQTGRRDHAPLKGTHQTPIKAELCGVSSTRVNWTLTSGAAEALSAMSHTFFRDEAACVTEKMSVSDRQEAAVAGLLLDSGLEPSHRDSSERLSAGEPLERKNSLLAEGSASHATPSVEDALSDLALEDSDDAFDAMASLMQAVLPSSTPPQASADTEVALLQSTSGTGTTSALTARLPPHENDPAANFFSLLTLGTPQNGDDASPTTAAHPAIQQATELLLPGLDVKAILSDNTIAHVQLSHKCMSQADFSFTRWHNVRAQHCDFSLCLFYKGVLHGPCVFERCCFDAAVLTGLRLMAASPPDGTNTAEPEASVRFVECSFRRATLGMCCDASIPVTQPMFVNCDFDLATFEKCQGWGARPGAFQRCINTETAAAFPLRARSGKQGGEVPWRASHYQ